MAAGETKTLTADVVLGPGESISAIGTAASRCTIEGQGFQIKAESFEGSIAISHCTLHGLGTVTKPGFDLSLSGNAAVQITDSTFTESGQTTLTVTGTATVDILRNDFAADLLVDPMLANFEKSVPAVLLSGQGSGLKRFQGNRVLVSFVKLDHASAWRIGGLTEGEGNIFYGPRAGIYVQASQGVAIQGNYLRATAPWNGSNRLMALGFEAENTDILVEHNLLRGGNRIVEGGFDGELRYNLIADPHGEYGVGGMSWTAKMRVHHNVITRSEAPEAAAPASSTYALYVGDLPNLPDPSPAATMEIFNNTVDWGDCYGQAGGAIGVGRHARIKSLRNNLFMRFSYPSAAIALVDAFPLPAAAEDPGPAVFDDADYNAFANDMAARADNYSASVAGKAERIDPGFAAHDLAIAGAKDQQVDPQLRGKLPVQFPFTDEALAGRTVTVCQVLKFYRAAYSPLVTSPLLGHGAPGDGSGVAIGAVGDGTGGDAQDQFGAVCPADVTSLSAVTDRQESCPILGEGGRGPGGAGGSAAGGGAAGGAAAGGAGGGAAGTLGGEGGAGGVAGAAAGAAGGEANAGGMAGLGATGGAAGSGGNGGKASTPSGIICVCAVADGPSWQMAFGSGGLFVALLRLRKRGSRRVTKSPPSRRVA